MGCCDAPESSDRSARAPQREKKCTDPLFMILFIAALGFSCYIMAQAFPQSEPIYVKGYDNWGNICGNNNKDAIYYQSNTEGASDEMIALNGYSQISIADGFSEVDLSGPGNSYYGMNHKENKKVFDARTIDLNAMFNQEPLTGNTHCFSHCPGDVSWVNETAFLDTDVVASLGTAIFASMQTDPPNKNVFKHMLNSIPVFQAISTKEEGSSNTVADDLTDELWCEDAFAAMGYNGTVPAAFCQKNPVLAPMSTMMNRICFPNSNIVKAIGFQFAENAAQSQGNSDNSTSFIKDLRKHSENLMADVQNGVALMRLPIILACIGSVFAAVLVIFIIQTCTKYIVKILVIGFFLVSVLAIAFVWVDLTIRSQKQVDAYSSVQILDSVQVCSEFKNGSASAVRDAFEQKINKKLVVPDMPACNDDILNESELQSRKYITWGVTLIAGLMIMGICCCWNNIGLAVELFDETGQCVLSMLGILFQPVITLSVTLVNLVIWASFILVASQVNERLLWSDGQVTFNGISLQWAWFGFPLFIIFNFFWVHVFIDGVHQVTIAGAVSNWFFSEEKTRSLNICPGFHAMLDTLKYNLGSIALGSMLIAILKTIQVVIWIVERQTKGTAPTAELEGAKKCIFQCLKCCTACVEWIMKRVNQNAFIGIAVYGYPFCRAATRCMGLKVMNAGRTMTTALICKGTLVLGKLITVFLTLGLYRLMITSRSAALAPMGSENLPMTASICIYLIVAAVAFLITSVFLSVYELALDTIFICFCEDQERNNGKDRPYYSSVRLQKFMRENV